MFRITSSGAFSTVHEFNSMNGANPHSKLILGADGALYGTTLAGGSANSGTIYRIVFGVVD